MTRTCKACDGTGYETAQCPKGEGGAICKCLDHRCVPCRGIGQVEERIPASDAECDAETFKRYIAERFVPTARQMTGTPWVYSGYIEDRETGRPLQTCCGRIMRHNSNRVAEACAKKAARRFRRAVFRAVPGLRA